jgi:hypothetical protein
MGALAQAANNPAGQNFLVWVMNVGGIPLLAALFAAIAFVMWFGRWLLRWSQRLAAAEFHVARSDLIRGIISGAALATVWLVADFLKLWQQQMPLQQQLQLQSPSDNMRQRFCSVPQVAVWPSTT